MKKQVCVAITGGIGSGKSYVCQLLRKRGIKVYDCDAAAKRLMHSDEALCQELRKLVGNEVFQGPELQKRVLAKFILASEANKQSVNDVVHPAVARDFIRSDCDWLESAIFFESGFYKRVNFDYVVCVSAPIEERVGRIMRRDGLSRRESLEWIRRQMPQEEVIRRSDFNIVNDGRQDLEIQIEQIIHKIYQ
ncbi:dephospho-CoA kinase [Prevotella sp. oral taxon 376]|uniref:dephospho-CoA kinase n=1 Tax=Prevotella sp. oral taxon 376 TaxID=712466 RepID=UPI0013048CCD|nr:dephospho-CoA kinase [Prevotella sp. oral taxon 376]